LPLFSKAEISQQLIVVEEYNVAIDSRPPFEKLRKLRLQLASGKLKRSVATGLAIALGPFGVHRLYLGTATKVPVIYSITLGGFFILPLIDIGIILFSKDFDRLKGDERVIMWSPKKEKSQTIH